MFVWPIAATPPSTVEASAMKMTICRQASVAGPIASTATRVEQRHRRDLGRGGEEGGDRGRRAFVDVRRPHVERHRADLEGEAGEDEDEAEQLAASRRRRPSAAAMPPNKVVPVKP